MAALALVFACGYTPEALAKDVEKSAFTKHVVAPAHHTSGQNRTLKASTGATVQRHLDGARATTNAEDTPAVHHFRRNLHQYSRQSPRTRLGD